MKKCQETGQLSDFTIAEFEEKANQVYIKSLEHIPTNKMHTIYLNFCMERLKLNSKFLNEERFTRLNELFKKIKSQFGLSLESSIEWIEYLIKFNHYKEAICLIEETLSKNKKCLNLWKLYLTIQIEETNAANQNDLIDLFNKSINAVKQKNQLDLWKLMVNWCLLNNYEKTEQILMVNKL
jgi:uncharacterized protein HemY